jgi:flagellar biosynthesis protein
MDKKDTPAGKKIGVAAALKYAHGEDGTPVVVATGKGDLAAKIIEIAKREDVPVYKDSVLAQALVKLGAGVEIPPDLYSAVAHVLVHVASLDKKVLASHVKHQP